MDTETSAEAQAEIDKLRSRPVVSLARFRELRVRLGGAQADDLLAELRDIALKLYRLHGDELVAWIDDCAREFDVPGKRNRRWLAGWLCERPYLWRTSQKVRRWYAEFAEVPATEVTAHVRDGRKVEAHRRLLGYEHLLHLAPPDSLVGEVLAIVAAGAHRRRGSRSSEPSE